MITNPPRDERSELATTARPDLVVVCFGFERERMRRQPWHVVHGLADGLHRRGRRVVVITDAADPPWLETYPVMQVRHLTTRGRPSNELKTLVDRLDPARVLVVTGGFGIVRMRAIDWRPATLLLIASPRLTLAEITAPGPKTLWHERRLLALPLLNALLPGALLRAGFRRSLACDAVYLSRATQARYAALGLPQGRWLRPQVEPFVHRPEASATRDPHVCYLGPPLALRGAWLALEAFERAVPLGLGCRLLLLLRSDVDTRALNRFIRRVERSPVRALIDCDVGMLSPTQLHERVAGCTAFILPFQAPVSEVPLVVLEAGLSGRPVVTLAAPGVTEYAEELGGIVVRDRRDLAHALIHAVRRGRTRGVDTGRWQGWCGAADVLMEGPGRRLVDYRFIALCGVDGSGKSFLLQHLQRELQAREIPGDIVWSRFRNYASKPLLALARLTGHNRRERVGETVTGYHDFQNRRWLAWPFIALQTLDNLIDLGLRYRRGGGRLVLGDRCIVDTLVDLAVDTGLDTFVLERLGPSLVRRLPAPRLIVLVQRHPRLVANDRPDALADRHFARRRVLYQRLADLFGLPIVDNDGTPQQAVATILRLAQNDEPVTGGTARDLRLLQQ